MTAHGPGAPRRHPPSPKASDLGASDEPGSVILPMFPLQNVLFPHGILPLHVFEPRYRSLAADCIAGDGRFGVVLIARGSEVGGGDQRVTTGTVATIERTAALAGDRLALVARGGSRLQVLHWLPDDPYPLGMVRISDEQASVPETGTDPGTGSDIDLVGGPRPAVLVAAATTALRQAYALRSELGLSPAWPASLELAPDPVTASWQLCDLAPLGAADRQRLLEASTVAERMALLQRLVAEVIDDLARMLAAG